MGQFLATSTKLQFIIVERVRLKSSGLQCVVSNAVERIKDVDELRQFGTGPARYWQSEAETLTTKAQTKPVVQSVVVGYIRHFCLINFISFV